MRRIVLTPILAFFVFTTTKAQSYSSNVSFQKNQFAVAAIQVPFEEDVVTDAVKDYMSRKGSKDSRYKDFIVFRGIPLDNTTAFTTDAYFNISRKSRSEKDVTVISLLPVKKNQTLAPGTIEDSSFLTAARVYLDSLKPFVLHYSIQQEINTQQKELGKAQTKYTRLKNDSGDIAKKIRGYEGDLVENKNDQDKQQKEISITSTGDHAALSKAQGRMDKLLNRQSDLEKKLRNAKDDAEKNKKGLEAQQDEVNKSSQMLDSLKVKLKDVSLPS